MDAFFAKNRLSAYLEGSLQEGEAAEVEQALAEDPALRAEYDAMRRAVKLLRDVGPVRAPPDLHARIMARVAVEPMVVGRAAWWRRTVSRLPMEGIALAAAALVVVIAIQWKPGEEQGADAQQKDVAAVEAPPQTPADRADQPPALSPPTTTPPERSLDLGKALPVGKPTPSTPKIASADPTAEPYRAEWEKQAEQVETSTVGDTTASATATTAETSTGTQVGMRTARYYQLNTQDPEVIARLSAIAAAAGGQLVTEDGQAATALTDDTPKMKVSMVIPQGQLGQVTAAVTELGARGAPAPAAAPLYGADTVTLNLTVFYNP